MTVSASSGSGTLQIDDDELGDVVRVATYRLSPNIVDGHRQGCHLPLPAKGRPSER
jgi:hypothetical protein